MNRDLAAMPPPYRGLDRWRLRLGFSPTGMVVFFAAVCLVAIWTTAVSHLLHERERTLEDARDNAASYVRAVEEHAVRTFQSADQTVLFFKYEIETDGPILDVGRYLRTGIVLGDIFNLITIVDAQGFVVGSSKPFERVNLADREHVRVHMKEDTGNLYISKPVLGRVSGKWSIQMTRRINKPDGGMDGVVVISMDPFYFTRFYRQIDADAPTSVTLVGLDGIVRALRIGPDESLNQDISASPIFRAIASGPTSRNVDATSSLDGRRKLYAYRKLEKYPLVAIVGIDEADALAPYVRTRDNTIGWAGAGSLLVLLFAVVTSVMFRRLEKSRREALAASRAKSEFLATMSHELRTPLHGILGYAELLAEEPRDEIEARYVDAIGKSGRHLLAIVNDILHLGRIEAGKMEVHEAPMSLRAFVEDVVSGHRSSASLKGLALDVAIDDALPETIVSDETKLKQVLNNLLHNAVKFTDRGGIAVSVTREAGVEPSMRIEVADTGCGIPAESLHRVFEKFQQVDSSLARAHEGTGLGLALVRQLAELLGGSVAVQSEPGAGSRFVVRIPLRAARTTPEGNA